MTEFVTAEDIDQALDVVPLLPTGLNGNTAHDSWTPINLNQLPDRPPIKPDLGGVGIVYPGKRHVFSGPPESAKTLAAYAIAIQVVRAGATVALVDFEMGCYDARSRLRELGATPAEIGALSYLEPDEPATPDRIATLVNLRPDLVIVDAAAGAYDLQGLDDNKRGDVEHLSRLYVGAFWRNRIASIFIDHVVKNTENRGKFVIGSERKLGGADVHLGFETINPISRGSNGLYKIVTHKDRGGWLKRGNLAELELASDPDTHSIEWTFRTPSVDTAEAGYFRPTHLMEKVSRHLELLHEPVTRNSIFETLGGTKDYVLKAIAALVAEGFATETDGARRSKLVSTVRAYREDDPACNPQTPASGSVVLCSSRVVREPQMWSGSSGSSPIRGDTTEPNHTDPPASSLWFDDLTDLAYLDELAPDDPDAPLDL